MRKRKAPYGFICFVVMLFCLMPCGALAAKLADVYITQGDKIEQSVDGALPIDAVRWWYSSKERAYYLFLPARSQPELRLWFDGPETLEVNGQTLHSGDAASFLTPGEELILTADKRKYTLRVMQSQNVPAMFITTKSGNLNYIHKRKENMETGVLRMQNADGSLSYDGTLSQIRGRGNSTFQLNKKPYQIKLDQSTDLCGMGKAKTWVLLADYRDNSLLRNKVTFALANAVGLPYTSKAQSVDLYINNDYYGTYLLCEKVEIGDSRININDLEKETQAVNSEALDTFKRFGKSAYTKGQSKGLQIPINPEDITGGYLLELDYKMRYKSEVSAFVTKRGQAVTVKEPECASQAQMAYISSFMQGFENAIFAKDGIDPDSGKHYSEFVDMDSLIKKYLVEEIVKNRDGNRSSLYFFKPEDSLSTVAFAGPVWDYDASMAGFATEPGQKIALPEYFAINGDSGEPFYWFPPLYKQKDFYEAMVKTYYEEFVPALEVLLGLKEDETGALSSIDTYAAEITASAAMNFIRWPVFNIPARVVQTGANYQENIDYIKIFLEKRMAFLQENWIMP